MPLSALAVRRAQSKRIAVVEQGQGTMQIAQRPVPFGGLNSRDAAGSLPPTDARVMDNIFPEPGAVRVRRGYELHATGVGSGDVKTIAELNVGTTKKLIAFSSTAAFDATTSGAAATSLKTGLTESGRWDWVNMNGSIVFVDGINAPQQYDGSTWANLTISGTGLTVANIVGIQVFKTRSFVWMKNSSDFFYSAAHAIGGTMTLFALSKLGAITSRGGHIVAIEPWTVDGGAGQDDFFVVVMSTGQVVVYSGTDPSDADKWALVGVYDVGRPMSRDGFVKHGGDLTGLLGNDYKRITAETLRTGSLPVGQSKISGLAASAVENYAANDGWQAIIHDDKLIFNVPVSSTVFYQHVQNLATQSWCRFKGINSRVWGSFDGDLYFGDGNGQIQKAFSGNSDGGSAINWEMRTAWDSFETPLLKRMTGIRPYLTTTGTITVNVGLAYDFNTTFTSGQDVVSVAKGGVWDTDDWDLVEWAPDETAQTDMYAVTGQGSSVGLRLKGQTTDQEVSLFRIDYMYTAGGVM
jgi:hypothetical protein